MDFFQQFAGIVIVLGALGAMVLIAKRRGFASFRLPTTSSRTKRLQVLERIALTPNHSLHLVMVDERTVLVAASPGGCQLLERHDPEGRQ